MNNGEYQSQKAKIFGEFKKFVSDFPSMKHEDIEEFIFHYIRNDELQLAYSNLVAMIINCSDALNKQLYQEIIQYGKNIRMGDGIVWDEKEADEWWIKLKNKSFER
jgi:hypothetical protein